MQEGKKPSGSPMYRSPEGHLLPRIDARALRSPDKGQLWAAFLKEKPHLGVVFRHLADAASVVVVVVGKGLPHPAPKVRAPGSGVGEEEASLSASIHEVAPPIPLR